MNPERVNTRYGLLLTILSLALAACGGGGGSSSSMGGGSTPPPIIAPPPPPIMDPMFLVSAASPFAVGCDGVAATGTLYTNAEVEPYIAVDPTNTNHMVGVWQQDRWSDGGAHGLMSSVSTDGGKTWTRAPIPFSRCAGGNSGNGGNYSRASDPWVSIGPTGIAYAISISFDGGIQQAGSDSAVLASRSLDGGHTWSNPATLILDGSSFFNDKESITADPISPSMVYAVWDRLPPGGGGPTYFARSTDSGATWEAARAIFDGGASEQTLGNEIVVLPNGTLINLFTLITTVGNTQSAAAEIIRSTDHGLTWSAPIKVADLLAVGARDPQTGAVVRDGADLPQIAAAPNGSLFVTWADARFSNGAHDAIAISRSSDGGLTWSAPTAINGDQTVEAFEPGVHVRPDGMVTVMYYDFRNNTADASTLPTILWLTRSTNASTWTESAVAGPFDLDTAPNAEGLFVGDYQGLTNLGNVIEPFFVITNSGNLANRTDVFSAPQASIAAFFNLLRQNTVRNATRANAFAMTSDFRKKVADNLGHVMERREVEWREHVKQLQKQPQQR